jgi:hypothetical protein
VTPKALHAALTWIRKRNDESEELPRSIRPAPRTAIPPDNEPKRDPDIETELLRERSSILVANLISSGAWSSERRPAVRVLRKSGNGFFVRLELRDDESCLMSKRVTGQLGSGRPPLDMLVGKADEDGELISLWVDRRRFEPVPKEVLTVWLFSRPMTEDRNLVPSENCRWWDSYHEHWDAQPSTPGRCAILPPVAGKRTGRAAWPSTEDTDWCGSFKPRSDAESEPDKEEF